MNIIEKIASEEGFSGKVYKCPADKLTIGYGFNLEALEMPKEVADLWLKMLVIKIIKQLQDHDWFTSLNEARQIAIVDMAYQMGITGLFKFRKMIEALEDYNFDMAAFEMLDSNYAKQTPARANRNAEIIKSGVI